MSSSDNSTDDDDKSSQLLPYPKIPYTKKDDKKMSTCYDKSKQQLTSK